jgi:hypothetical protein
VSGSGTSPSCTSAEEAKESTKVENVTSGKNSLREELLLSELIPFCLLVFAVMHIF